MRYFLILLIALCCPFASAEQDASGRHIVEMTNPKDAACTQCHKTGKLEHKGFHVGLKQNSDEPITCTNCHGNADRLHRNNIKDVMKFQPDLFSAKQDYRPDQQNAVCFTCHQPKVLQEKFWPHDVHANKLSCAACHTLHVDKQAQDAMHQIDRASQVTLCVTCHQKQTDLKQRNKEIKP